MSPHPTCTPLSRELPPLLQTPRTSPCHLGTMASPSSPGVLAAPGEPLAHGAREGVTVSARSTGVGGLCPGAWPARTPQRAGHTTGSALRGLVCAPPGPAVRVRGDPCCPGPREPGEPGACGLTFTASTPAVVVPSLQRSFGPNPCRFCSSWLSEPQGQIKWLSLWLSVSREPGLGQADGGFPEPPSGDLHPLLLQPCPTALSPRTQKDAPSLSKAQWERQGLPASQLDRGQDCLAHGRVAGTAAPAGRLAPARGLQTPGPTLLVPARSPLSPGLGGAVFIPTSQMKTPRLQRGRDAPQPRVPARF